MPVHACPLCKNTDLFVMLDLGFHPLADTFLKLEELSLGEKRYPLVMVMCKKCGHAMNSFVVPKEERYQTHEYSYDSSNSKVSIEHFDTLAKEVSLAVGVDKDDLVVDIGGNVGTLLQAFQKHTNAKVLNVEPSGNIGAIAVANGVDTLHDFFGAKAQEEITKRGGAKVITATNAFNHIDGLDDFMSHIESSLVPDGAFVFEVPYLLHLVEKLAFDTAYLEHVSYFSIRPLREYLQKYHLTITEVVENEYMGGSIRVTARLGAHTETPEVLRLIEKELAMGLFEPALYERMAKKVEEFKFALLSQLIEAKKAGGKIIGIGAATKGNTLLNYCGIDTTYLDFITDASTLKIGKCTPGSHIPIRPDDAISSEVTHALILPWNIADFLKSKLSPKYPHIAFITPHMEQ